MSANLHARIVLSGIDTVLSAAEDPVYAADLRSLTNRVYILNGEDACTDVGAWLAFCHGWARASVTWSARYADLQDDYRALELRTMPYRDYLATPEWAAKRDEALERDGHACRLCNATARLEVHHRTYERRGDEDVDDLTTLCHGCHGHHHRHRDGNGKATNASAMLDRLGAR